MCRVSYRISDTGSWWLALSFPHMWDHSILTPWYSPYRDHIPLCLGRCNNNNNNNIHCSRNLASLTNLIQVLINICCSSRTPDLHYLRHQHHSLSHYSLNSFGGAISNVATGSVEVDIASADGSEVEDDAEAVSPPPDPNPHLLSPEPFGLLLPLLDIDYNLEISGKNNSIGTNINDQQCNLISVTTLSTAATAVLCTVHHIQCSTLQQSRVAVICSLIVVSCVWATCGDP